jgi:hypothetical protein
LKTWEQAVAELKSEPSNEQIVKACFFDDPIENALERYYSST